MSIKNVEKIQSFEDSVRKIKLTGPAPVNSWDPDFCGNINIKIQKDGTWLYNGSPINRIKLVKLFSNILKKEGNNYFLVTPVEKVGIMVEDAPFLINNLDITGQGRGKTFDFTTQVGDTVRLSKNNPLRFTFNSKSFEPSPYILVRNNLEALIDRKNFYRLINSGETSEYKNENWFGVWSENTFFPIISSKSLSE